MYTAGASASGKDTFTFTISDSHGGTFTSTMTVHIVTAYSWTGLTTGTWNSSTGSNWCGSLKSDKTGCKGDGAVPGSADIAIIDDTCISSFCSPTTNYNVSVYGVRLAAGTLTQGTGTSFSVGDAGWSQTGGAFVGADGALSFKIYSQSGGAFKSTSGTLTLPLNTNGNYTAFSQTGGTFDHNSGTVLFYGSTAYDFARYTINVVTGLTFYNIIFSGGDYNGRESLYYITNPVTVSHELTIKSDGAGGTRFDGGTINLSGNMIALSGAHNQGNGRIIVNGNSAQTYSGTGAFPYLEINTTGSFSPASGTTGLEVTCFTLMQGTFNSPSGFLSIETPYNATLTGFNYSGGTFNHNNGTVQLVGITAYNHSHITIAGPVGLTFYNLVFNSATYNGSQTHYYLNQTTNVLNDFTISGSAGGTSQFDSGTLNVKGNISAVNGASWSGTGNLVLNGTSAQTYSGTGSFPYLIIDNPTTVTPAVGTTSLNVSVLKIQQGSFTAPTGALTVSPPTNSNLTAFDFSGGTFINNSGTVVIYGSSSYSYSQTTINGYTALNFYNLNIGSGGYNPGASDFYLGQNVTVANTTNVSDSTSRPHMNGKNLTTQVLTLAGTTLTRDGGTLTVNGSPVGSGAYGAGTIGN